MLYSRQLLAFIAVAEELHFGRAAKRLHISQPPLSQQIRRFEQDAGIELFVRTTRSVALTPAGQALLDSARRLIEQGNASLIAARQVASGEVGSLMLGFTSTAAYYALPRAIAAYRQRYPKVQLVLQEQNSTELWQGLVAGRIDVALLRRHSSMSEGTFKFLPAGSEPLVVAMPATHVLASAARIRIGDLRGEPLVAFAQRTSSYFHALIGALFSGAQVEPQIVHESVLPTMLSLVEAGVGIALVPKSAAAMRPGNLVFRPLQARGAVARLHIALRAGSSNAAASAFAEIARASVRS